jgi:cell division protein FtsW
MPRRRAFDRWLFLTAVLFVVGGVFMVGSASHYIAMSQGKAPTYFLVRQILFLCLGGLLMAGAMKLPLAWLNDRRVVYGLVATSIVLLLGVLAAPSSQGAHRWFRIGPFGVQPSELAKITTVILLAHVLARRTAEQVNDLRQTLVPLVGTIGLLAMLIVIEPDLGSAVILLATAATLLFVSGLRWRYIGATAAAGAIFVVGAIIAQPYRLQRIKTFLNPGADTQGAGFQLAQSLLAVGSGGLWGVGLGQGQQKAYYLPAAHTDFIFSVIGEELGLVGTLLVLAGVALLAWRGFRAALNAPDGFELHVALGATCLIVLQSLVHMGVCVGLLPTKGLSFPLLSYGGSSLVASLVVVGLLLNVSQHSN